MALVPMFNLVGCVDGTANSKANGTSQFTNGVAVSVAILSDFEKNHVYWIHIIALLV